MDTRLTWRPTSINVLLLEIQYYNFEYFYQEKEPAPAPRTETFRNKKEHYKVVYAFSPRNPDELELQEGEQVIVRSPYSEFRCEVRMFVAKFQSSFQNLQAGL